MEVQLAKTTPYLSGQQRIDIELKSENSNITDSNIHIVPLSDNIIFNENNKRVVLNYPHEENLKYLYNQTKSTFWNNVKEREDTIYWVKNGDILDTYDHTYQCGTKRIRYKRYNKQYGCLVPIWIEKQWDDNWAFKITINTQSYTLLTSKIILLSDKFKNYLKEYTDGLNEEVININSERNEIYVNGLNVEKGISSLKDVSYIYNNIISRERPLIEFDSMLCSAFVNNNMIAKQLINFNFVFNIEDIVNIYQSILMNGNKWNIFIEFGTYINGTFTPFEKKDIYTNYNFIPKYKLDDGNGSYSNSNVLDYLEDNKCVDFIYANKTTQPICHWALKDNQNYIYNFYNGFSPINDTLTGDCTAGSYFNTPIISTEKFDLKTNNIGWCKRLYNRDSNYILSTYNNENNFTKIPASLKSGNSYWIETLKYLIKEDITHHIPEDEIYFQLVYNDQNLPISQQSGTITLKNSNNVTQSFNVIYNTSIQNKLFISFVTFETTNNIEWFTFKNFKNCSVNGMPDYHTNPTTTLEKIENVLFSIFKIFKYISVPTKFIYNKGIIPIKANTKSIESKEIKYLKADKNTYSYLYRYTDNIKPMFIDNDDNNILYNTEWKCKIFNNFTEDVAKIYNNGIKQRESDLYPSTGYFALEKIEDIDDKTKYNSIPSFYSNFDEVKWFLKSIQYKLPETININVYLRPNDTQSSFPIVTEFTKNTPYIALENYFNNISTPPNNFNYIFNLYDFEYEFEYENDTNIDNINYYITYKLK